WAARPATSATASIRTRPCPSRWAWPPRCTKARSPTCIFPSASNATREARMGELGWFLGGIVLLLLGGDSLARGASGFAPHCGVGPYRAGLVLLAFATSIPELVVNGYAIGAGQPELALGNAVGSNIVNLGLTLGVAALAAPLAVRLRLAALQLVLLPLAGGAVVFFAIDGRL